MFVSGIYCYGSKFPPEISLRITLKNIQQIFVTIYGSADYISVSKDPWKPFGWAILLHFGCLYNKK